MPSTRLAAALAPKCAALAATRELFEQRFGAIDAKLADTECYMCLGSEGPLTCCNAQLMICGHACHFECEMKARQLQWQLMSDALEGVAVDAPLSEAAAGLRCGFCRYKRVGNDGVSLHELRRGLLFATNDLTASTIKDVEVAWRYQTRRIQVLSDKLSLCEGTFDGTYGTDRPYPTECFKEDVCIVM